MEEYNVKKSKVKPRTNKNNTQLNESLFWNT
jgi:hypothetical protein